jgi:metal-responsive CopG/Arc/MetJ family transcriptional regulator
MQGARKVKISVTIDADLLSEIDRYAENSDDQTRSSVIEAWLRKAARREAATQLEHETIAYYRSLSLAQHKEDDTWSEAASRHFAKLDID